MTVELLAAVTACFLPWSCEGITLTPSRQVLNIGDETLVVWKKPLTVGKVLYIIVRYPTLCFMCFDGSVQFLSGLSDKVQTFHFTSSGEFLQSYSPSFILSTRLYAVYGGSRRMIVALGILVLTGTVGTCTLLGLINLKGNGTMRVDGLQNVHDIQKREGFQVVGYVDEGQYCGSGAYQLHYMVPGRHSQLPRVRNGLDGYSLLHNGLSSPLKYNDRSGQPGDTHSAATYGD
ncbi:hypothetical protein BU17DRAFT_70788 [Hysterangium stoloniferum]|nr:hypothetical protein BU17DRAFT_70788 [Hysterangium stoloniferum]